MTKKKSNNSIALPKSSAEFRKLIKRFSAEKFNQLDKPQLQQLYDRAKVAYPDAGGGQISRKERENLYLLQSKLFGHLDPKLQASLENIGQTLVHKPQKRKKAINYKLPNAGGVIVKNWKGQQLKIKIVAEGFEYEGQLYKSLSKLAKEITGYAVSGPIFFGLRKPKMKGEAA